MRQNLFRIVTIVFGLIADKSFAAPSPIASQPNLTFAQLQSFVTTAKVKTIDELVPLLPTQMLQNSILVYDSHALNIPLVTPETPRVILFNRDASLVLAFTRNPGAKAVAAGDDQLEIADFDKTRGTFEFRTVQFTGKALPFAKPSETNPALCLTCHGDNPRPIFNDYNTWPGIYGSFSQKGYAIKGTKEYLWFKDFLASASKQPRYKDLDLSRVRDDSIGLSIPSQGFGVFYSEKKFTPALAFGAQLEFRMYERLAKTFESSDKAEKIIGIVSYLGRADNCYGSPIGHRREIRNLYQEWLKALGANADRAGLINEKIETQVSVDHQAKQAFFTPYNQAPKTIDPRGMMNLPFESYVLGSPSWTTVDKVAFSNQMVLLESIGQLLKLNTKDFSTSLDRPTLGIFHIRKSTLYPDEQMFEGLYSGLVAVDSRLLEKVKNLSCGDLKVRALRELENLPVPQVSVAPIFYR